MDDKEVEKKLQESADNIETRDFSLVWKDIQHKVEVPQKKMPAFWWKLAASAASIAVACSIIIPLAINQNQQQADTDSSSSSSQQLVYLADELSVVDATAEDFFNQVAMAGIDLVDVSDYMVVSSALFKAPDAVVKGGQLELTDDLENSTVFLMLRMYDQSVVVEDELQTQYNFNYTVNDASIEYRIKEAYPDVGIYIYDIKANANSVNYYMEYTCFTEDIKPFLDEFFQ